MAQDQDGISAYLNGKLLLATPSIGDPRFHHAVIFLAAHDEHGAMGLVVNMQFPGLAFSELLGQLGLQSDINIDLDQLDLPVMEGGPVEPSRGFLLHSMDFQQADTVKIGPDFGITGTTDALRKLVRGNGPRQALFILGYAGWTAGQLEQELQNNAWLVVDPDPELVFSKGGDDKWLSAVKKLGIDPAMLSSNMGRA